MQLMAWVLMQLQGVLWRERYEVGNVTLEAGRNRVLVKVEVGTGGWAFRLRVLDEDGFPARVTWSAELD